MKRYAACSSAEEIQETEQTWLAKIEREYSESRADRNATTEDQAWSKGNRNRRKVNDSDSDESEDGDSQMSGEESNPAEDDQDSLGLPEASDDEEQMAELRRKVLQSRPFTNPTDTEQKAPLEKIIRAEVESNQNSEPVDSDAESGTDVGEDDEFDNIMMATPVTDKTGITAKQRQKAQDKATAAFSRTVVSAPSRWPS